MSSVTSTTARCPDDLVESTHFGVDTCQNSTSVSIKSWWSLETESGITLRADLSWEGLLHTDTHRKPPLPNFSPQCMLPQVFLTAVRSIWRTPKKSLGGFGKLEVIRTLINQSCSILQVQQKGFCCLRASWLAQDVMCWLYWLCWVLFDKEMAEELGLGRPSKKEEEKEVVSQRNKYQPLLKRKVTTLTQSLQNAQVRFGQQLLLLVIVTLWDENKAFQVEQSVLEIVLVAN